MPLPSRQRNRSRKNTKKVRSAIEKRAARLASRELHSRTSPNCTLYPESAQSCAASGNHKSEACVRNSASAAARFSRSLEMSNRSSRSLSEADFGSMS